MRRSWFTIASFMFLLAVCLQMSRQINAQEVPDALSLNRKGELLAKEGKQGEAIV
jgi:hypothetical protein